MTTASDIMTKEVITVTPDMEVTQAAEILFENHVNGLPVVDESGHLVGIICQSDIIVQQKELPLPSLFGFLDGFLTFTNIKSLEKRVRKIAAITVEHAMTPDPVTVNPDTAIKTVAALMVDNNFHTIPVVDGGKLVGVIGKEDVLKTLIPKAG